MSVASKLKTIRKQKNYSQKKLAESIGVCPKTISKIECGESLPSLEVALLIADCFHISLQDIFYLE